MCVSRVENVFPNKTCAHDCFFVCFMKRKLPSYEFSFHHGEETSELRVFFSSWWPGIAHLGGQWAIKRGVSCFCTQVISHRERRHSCDIDTVASHSHLAGKRGVSCVFATHAISHKACRHLLGHRYKRHRFATQDNRRC